MGLSLARQRHPLANTASQRELIAARGDRPEFLEVLERHGLARPRADESGIGVLQINLGKLCNQTCEHCHVDAGPDRREVMDEATMRWCLDVARREKVPVVDITGGAPEMNPRFRWLVAEARSLGCHVIDRCNLTILQAPGFTDLPEFLAEHRVEVVASLPCYLESNTDAQRGEGVHARSIKALKRLNELGYGQPGSSSGLTLSLVYNPVGTGLPPDQAQLEADYRRELRARHGIEFTRLYTITNMPISRFLEALQREGRVESYMEKLLEAFNPSAVAGLMCRATISVGWDGRLFDCDFNQMLDLSLARGLPQHIRDFDRDLLTGRLIVTGEHCFGCTAGAGSSCQGAIVLDNSV